MQDKLRPMEPDHCYEELESQIGLLMNLKKPKSFDFLFWVIGWSANSAEPLNSIGNPEETAYVVLYTTYVV